MLIYVSYILAPLEHSKHPTLNTILGFRFSVSQSFLVQSDFLKFHWHHVFVKDELDPRRFLKILNKSTDWCISACSGDVASTSNNQCDVFVTLAGKIYGLINIFIIWLFSPSTIQASFSLPPATGPLVGAPSFAPSCVLWRLLRVWSRVSFSFSPTWT